eukprot:4205395-Heterocapsa_arctica.AAC.1
MKKCERPIVGRQKRTIVDSHEQSNKRVRPWQDLQSDAGEGRQLDHEAERSGRKGPMDVAIEVIDEAGDQGRQHEGDKGMEHDMETCYGKD